MGLFLLDCAMIPKLWQTWDNKSLKRNIRQAERKAYTLFKKGDQETDPNIQNKLWDKAFSELNDINTGAQCIAKYPQRQYEIVRFFSDHIYEKLEVHLQSNLKGNYNKPFFYLKKSSDARITNPSKAVAHIISILTDNEITADKVRQARKGKAWNH